MSTMSGEEAYGSLADSACPLVKTLRRGTASGRAEALPETRAQQK